MAAASSHRDRDLGRRFEPLGLTVEKYRSMLAIARFPGCTMKELSSFTSIDRTTLTRMIDQLVAVGWVTREHAVRDRRQVVLGLTPEGMDVGRSAVDLLTEANRQAAASLSDHDLDGAARVLEGVLRNLIADDDLLHRVMALRRPGES
ncbi:MAG TPA: MarR family transcriptional regulator [Phenylobacterium sp.]|nr:MarR family transcriptional regulator [Phenylobacterium sp.]